MPFRKSWTTMASDNPLSRRRRVSLKKRRLSLERTGFDLMTRYIDQSRLTTEGSSLVLAPQPTLRTVASAFQVITDINLRREHLVGFAQAGLPQQGTKALHPVLAQRLGVEFEHQELHPSECVGMIFDKRALGALDVHDHGVEPAAVRRFDVGGGP